MPNTILVDRRNADLIPSIAEAVGSTPFVGVDCETEDSRRHEGLNQFMKVNEEGKKAGNKKLVFDHRRTTMTGFSLYPENHDVAYYFNLGHADVENRLPFELCRPLFQSNPTWISHNAPFELTMFKSCHDIDLLNVICTLQLSVTAFGDDNYDLQEFRTSSLRGMEKWPMELLKAALKNVPVGDDDDDDDGGPKRRFNREVEDIISKIASKTSDAEHSYNGYIKSMAYGHGLKQLVRSIFGHQMGTFEETLAGNAHMGQLTGNEVADYGAEDAYWVVPLFRYLLQYVAMNSPRAIPTFFEQENPMIHVFSELWMGGMKVDFDSIESRRGQERQEFARILRELRGALKSYSFNTDPNSELAKRQSWYDKNHDRYRKLITDWVALPNSNDDFEECIRVSNAVPNAWAEERKDKRRGPLSISHYMPVRVLLYDLLGAKMQFDMGKLQSDGEARGKIKIWMEQQGLDTTVLDLMSQLASVETRMKTYLTPYMLLTDPETHCLYPSVSSMLNTRRMASAIPNVMALAKRGESTYVRGFFRGDR